MKCYKGSTGQKVQLPVPQTVPDRPQGRDPHERGDSTSPGTSSVSTPTCLVKTSSGGESLPSRLCPCPCQLLPRPRCRHTLYHAHTHSGFFLVLSSCYLGFRVCRLEQQMSFLSSQPTLRDRCGELSCWLANQRTRT
uniref:uncharacterized protein LOC120812475 isoform X4 n=1 Tax=Gasterosteus aculeatus aculeatus TaxID=481459 RepID=UPI001A99FE5B|nr:uncharacterized protein LOC120812475 isoform X4 [Gasterosteus aculeatus aculeatus]